MCSDLTADADLENAALMSVRVKWEDPSHILGIKFFEHLLERTLTSYDGILCGAAIITILSFDEGNQKAAISIVPQSKASNLKCALYFLTSYQGIKCRAFIDA
ncbi:hypothetical protein MDAP_000628 [Mitosporidium daphniae]|uniref:Uncharacterized protein n=1 Tax=Mitosporidium daphniae TaxID=1485682 RepID=A0A098VUD2_9MICR|nr:uncharacterized protein DI09_15p320 [Mitosporidium daphniae]KGG52565.1 hypothetical protein DI09_15p320 [Mitosporidium daphniae]|eukprot:XP_013238992.1 uncharacterized protein DI09_15p320 [Mitosporidium daphniae]